MFSTQRDQQNCSLPREAKTADTAWHARACMQDTFYLLHILQHPRDIHVEVNERKVALERERIDRNRYLLYYLSTL